MEHTTRLGSYQSQWAEDAESGLRGAVKSIERKAAGERELLCRQHQLELAERDATIRGLRVVVRELRAELRARARPAGAAVVRPFAKRSPS